MSNTEGGESTPLQKAISAAAAVSQAALTAAVLYWFGLVYTRAWYAHFGIDSRQLDLSTSDYVVRSINGGFFPILLGLLAIVALLTLRSAPIMLAARTRHPRKTMRVLVGVVEVCALLLCATVAVGVLIRDSLPHWMSLGLPLMLIAGVGLLGYQVHLRVTYRNLLRRRGAARTSAPTPWLYIFALLILGFLGTFWAVGSVAVDQAARDAETEEERGFGNRPVVVVFSVERLAIASGGARVAPITTPGEKYHFQYSGLLMLARTNDRYFLIPQDWSRKHRDRVFIINTSDNIRIDVAPHP